MAQHADAERVDQRVAGVGLVEDGLAADVGQAEAVAVAADAGHDPGQHPRGVGGVERAEAQRVHHRDRPRAHREDVADDAADPGGRALVGLDERRVVVALDLEGHGVALADVEDAGVLTDAGEHLADRRLLRDLAELLEVHLGRLVGAVLAPHHAVHRQLRAGRAAAEDLADPGVLVGLEAQLGPRLLALGVGGRQGHRVEGAVAPEVVRPEVVEGGTAGRRSCRARRQSTGAGAPGPRASVSASGPRPSSRLAVSSVVRLVVQFVVLDDLHRRGPPARARLCSASRSALPGGALGPLLRERGALGLLLRLAPGRVTLACQPGGLVRRSRPPASGSRTGGHRPGRCPCRATSSRRARPWRRRPSRRWAAWRWSPLRAASAAADARSRRWRPAARDRPRRVRSGRASETEIGAIGGSAATPDWAEPGTEVDAGAIVPTPDSSPPGQPSGERATGEDRQLGADHDELGARGPQPGALLVERQRQPATDLVGLRLPPRDLAAVVVLGRAGRRGGATPPRRRGGPSRPSVQAWSSSFCEEVRTALTARRQPAITAGQGGEAVEVGEHLAPVLLVALGRRRVPALGRPPCGRRRARRRDGPAARRSRSSAGRRASSGRTSARSSHGLAGTVSAPRVPAYGRRRSS